MKTLIIISFIICALNFGISLAVLFNKRFSKIYLFSFLTSDFAEEISGRRKKSIVIPASFSISFQEYFLLNLALNFVLFLFLWLLILIPRELILSVLLTGIIILVLAGLYKGIYYLLKKQNKL